MMDRIIGPDGDEIIVSSSGGRLANAAATLSTIFLDPLRPATIQVLPQLQAITASDPSHELEKITRDLKRILEEAPNREPPLADSARPPSEAAEDQELTEKALASTAASIERDAHSLEVASTARLATRSPPQKRRATAHDIPIASHFKLIFLSILALTILVGIAFIALAVFVQAPTPGQLTAIETLRTLMIAGFSGIFGILGGKIIQ